MSSALLYVYVGTVKVYMTSQYLYPYIFPIGLCAKMIMKEVTQCWLGSIHCQYLKQGSQIHQNCFNDSTEVTEGVALNPEIFGNKQGATSTPEIFGYKHSFVLTFFATNTIYINCKRCKPLLNHQN